MTKENEIIINGQGTVRAIGRPSTQFDRSTSFLQEARRIEQEYGIGATEAVWNVNAPYPNRPIGILLATDIHYGSTKVDYDTLLKHLDIVENTPNMYMVSNGDAIDNFNVMLKSATGAYENPLSPQRQTEALIEKFKVLDRKKKIGCISFGNHDDFVGGVGYEFWETWGRDLNMPIFLTGGLLHIIHRSEKYEMAMTHRYWGSSKLNPTNTAKRYLEHEYPDADIVFIGHTHQSENLTFERGGKERIAIIGGTYKKDDMFARKHGIGGRSGAPGNTILLYPNERKMISFKHLEDALPHL